MIEQIVSASLHNGPQCLSFICASPLKINLWVKFPGWRCLAIINATDTALRKGHHSIARAATIWRCRQDLQFESRDVRSVYIYLFFYFSLVSLKCLSDFCFFSFFSFRSKAAAGFVDQQQAQGPVSRKHL